ncbi:uncharacterized protein LOC127839638 [Dreissena polymorpha]|uniref:uncharacterized protein LOC127839638 n=1 Tax=Dreissena polymorpha TaxID=45954 RepID=UPI0022642E2C|nr:uncharacterized protein LOC127839638 [Dreissena polymorpha]
MAELFSGNYDYFGNATAPYNETYNVTYILNENELDNLRQLHAMDREREKMMYVYNSMAGCIFFFNCVVLLLILSNRNERKHFRNWLILHMAVIHMLHSSIALPFLAQTFKAPSAGLVNDIGLCKFLFFLSDILNYILHVSIGILGVYQCITTISLRLLKSVSSVFLVSIMMILPWFVVVMLSAVLRLTMSEEQWGGCYIISDTTATTLWFIMATVLPFILITCCFVTLIVCTAVKATTDCSPSRSARHLHMTYFVGFCLCVCIMMKIPYHVVVFDPVRMLCYQSLNQLACYRIEYALDIANLSGMLMIPIVYIVPNVIHGCRLLKNRFLCKTGDCSTNVKKPQSIEMACMSSSER